MEKVKLTINNKETTVPSDFTILQAAEDLGIEIPRLCYLEGISKTSSCRICLVEVSGEKTLVNSCAIKVSEGMEVKTNTKRVKDAVRKNLQLLAANHRFDCWSCSREHNCELLDLMRKYNVDNVIGNDKTFEKRPVNLNISSSLVLDTSKCILCGRCISACESLTGLGILNFNDRGYLTYVGPANNTNFEESGCIYCGKCIQSCPVGALYAKSDIDRVEEILENKVSSIYKIKEEKDKYFTVVAIAPSVRASLGEEFGMPIGTNVEGKIYNALNKLGFNEITDINFGADMTITEEANELIERLEKREEGKKVVLPMFTSCSPGWVRYIERYYPKFIPHLSSCRSPQGMHGSMLKYIYEKEYGIPRKRIKIVSIMPCIAKKDEILRPELSVKGNPDIDVVITTVELAKLIKRKGIDFTKLKNYTPESPFAKFTGAGAIFGATGGVMEAALRTVKARLDKEDLNVIEFKAVRGIEDIKEAEVEIAGKKYLVAVVHGATHFPEMLKRVKESKKEYAFVEFMGCTGGCVNGGGQPVLPAKLQEELDIRKERAKALYNQDEKLEYRRSHENPSIIYIYEKHLEHPGSPLAHKLLHTKFKKKNYYK